MLPFKKLGDYSAKIIQFIGWQIFCIGLAKVGSNS